MLDLSNNQITQIPGSITSLKNVTEINFSSNKITEFPPLENPTLETINFSDNQLSTLPLTLGTLPSLMHFDVSSNHLKNIDFPFQNPKLTSLNLDRNKLSLLKKNCFLSLSHLTILSLRHNLLTEFLEFPNSDKLESLSIGMLMFCLCSFLSLCEFVRFCRLLCFHWTVLIRQIFWFDTDKDWTNLFEQSKPFNGMIRTNQTHKNYIGTKPVMAKKQ